MLCGALPGRKHFIIRLVLGWDRVTPRVARDSFLVPSFSQVIPKAPWPQSQTVNQTHWACWIHFPTHPVWHRVSLEGCRDSFPHTDPRDRIPVTKSLAGALFASAHSCQAQVLCNLPRSLLERSLGLTSPTQGLLSFPGSCVYSKHHIPPCLELVQVSCAAGERPNCRDTARWTCGGALLSPPRVKKNFVLGLKQIWAGIWTPPETGKLLAGDWPPQGAIIYEVLFLFWPSIPKGESRGGWIKVLN